MRVVRIDITTSEGLHAASTKRILALGSTL